MEDRDIQGLVRVTAQRIATDDATRTPPAEDCDVAVETPLTIAVADAAAYTLMCSPIDLRALAVGFLHSEGMIAGLGDILMLQECPDAADVLRVRLANPAKATTRNLLVASSCGLCGSEDVETMLAGLPRVGDTLRVSGATLRTVARALRDKQTLFARSGGTHAAGIFTADGEIIAFGEDVGRHNALDKAIGKCLLQGRNPRGCGATLSGRLSLEMIVKCARAGIEVVSAVSAPTSLALDAASRCHITVAAFVRETRATLFTVPQRVIGTP